MTLYALANTTPAPTVKYYLDTSAVVPLALDEGTKKGGPPVEEPDRTRANVLKDFLKRSLGTGAVVRTSLLALEEIAAQVRNGERRLAAQNAGFSSWKSFRSAKRNEAASDDVIAQAKMLTVLQWAVASLSTNGVQLERRAIMNVTLAATMLKKAREHYEALLKHYVTLDAMDALHIVVGKELGASGFVTFDEGWQSVAEIDVYR